MSASSDIVNHLATGALLLLIAVSAGADPALHLDPATGTMVLETGRLH